MNAAGIILLLLIGLALLWLSRLFNREADMPSGAVVYSDSQALGKQTKALYSQRYRLSGKPDYLVEQGDTIIPVEYKSSRAPRSQPYYGHKLQAAAYCLLVEETFGITPPYALLKYSDREFRVPFTQKLRGHLLNALDDIADNQAAPTVDRNHDVAARCRNCGFNNVCDQRLA